MECREGAGQKIRANLLEGELVEDPDGGAGTPLWEEALRHICNPKQLSIGDSACVKDEKGSLDYQAPMLIEASHPGLC